MFLRFPPGILSGDLRSKGCRLARSLEPYKTGGDQAIVLPWASVILIIVLLKDARTCATPAVIFLRTRLRLRP